MADRYLPLLILLVVIAAIFRDDFSFTLLYLFAGAFALGTWWSRGALARLRYRRVFNHHVFLDESVTVDLQVENGGWLPLPWLRIHEGLPVELTGPESFRRVTQLGPRQKKTFQYIFTASRRGYYPIGPLFFSSSDILGLSSRDQRREGEAEYLTVYPRIVPLTKVRFPSQSPLGTLRHHQPVFEDPSRVMGVRPYLPGDSLRRVDWKSTAVSGQMQVKLFEPSIALETVIFLNLNAEDYYYRYRIAGSELAVVIAASLANWVVDKGQTVGLYAHGMDPLGQQERASYIPARAGRGHLMRILEVLARVQVDEGESFSQAIRQRAVHLSWGTTLTVITGMVDDDTLEVLYQARRSGLSVSLILAGRVIGAREIEYKASFFGIPVINITQEKDMEVWRQ
jgi:uncharacterized protein (DUF58 family)